jgi:GT2 family glycosyltransferase
MRKLSLILDGLIAAGVAIFLAVLPFHLVVKKLVPDPAGTYWKEMLLGILIVVWGIRHLVALLGPGQTGQARTERLRRLLLTETPLHLAVMIYLGLLLLRFVLDRPSLAGAWGLYASVMYLPLFWLVQDVLRRQPGWVAWLVALLVTVGALVSLGGLAEFALDRQLWPSDELMQRYGSSDAFIYGTHLRRAYFTFDSPTALANTLGLLLPLALAAVLIAPRWLRLAAGVATVLMAACIVVTFSRGIWVAVVLALLAAAVLSALVQRRKQILIAMVGALVFIGLVWGAVIILRPGQATPTHQDVVELSPEAYRAAPVTRIAQELLQTEPDYGEVITQTWTLQDPIAGRADKRLVLYEHPPESGKVEIIYRVTVPEAGALRFSAALSPQVWSPDKGDGASFQLYVTEPGAAEEGQFVFVRYINPKHNPSDRRWRNFLVDLSPWAGRTINLSLITEGGPAGDWAFDWAGWADLQLVSLPPGYMASAQADNAALSYTASILDWVRDETNRDRLAAWGLSLSAWRQSPLWGQGLGSTGLAALRTNPERAFVTESQVFKALVELGLPGLLALAYLWFQIARVGYRAYRPSREADAHSAGEPSTRLLVLGILASLLIVFIEGWVYQNLEVKQVNAYFWSLVGMLACLGSGQIERSDRDREMAPSVSVIIVNWNHGHMLEGCLDALSSQGYPELDITIVDNASTDGSPAWIASRYPAIHLHTFSTNTGFSRAVNYGIEHSDGEFVLSLNPDVTVQAGFVAEMVEAAGQDERIGVVAPKLLQAGKPSVLDSTGLFVDRRRRPYDRGQGEEDQGQYDSGFAICNLRFAKHEVFGACGGAALYRRAMLEDVAVEGEYLDEDFFAYYEDLDLAWRAQLRGWRAVYAPGAVATHVRGWGDRLSKRERGAGRPGAICGPRLALRNRYLTVIKNDAWQHLVADLPRIVAAELPRLAYAALVVPEALLGILDLVRAAPRALHERRLIRGRQAIEDNVIRQWFT